jgi:DNA-binding NtrC family response regulator
LVVEDDPQLRPLLARALSGAGFQVVAVGSLRAATDALATRGPFALLVSDVILPGGSGITLARSARDLQPGLPIVLASGYLEEAALIPEIHGLGMVPLAKPFGHAEITAAVRRALGYRSMNAEETPRSN